MFFLHDTVGRKERFKTLDELKEHIEIRHAEEGGLTGFLKSEMAMGIPMDAVGM
jgi:hypothetical protein